MLTNIFAMIRTVCRDEKGVTAIEYGLIAALVAIAIVGGLGSLSGGLTSLFETVAGKLGG